MPSASQSSHTYQELLERAAEVCGIEPEFWDIWGKKHLTSAETKRAILKALQVNCDTEEQLKQALEDRLRREWLKVLPPCLVASVNEQPCSVVLHVPREAMQAAAHFEIHLEGGQTQTFHTPLQPLPETAAAEIDGRGYAAKRVQLPVHLALGYHRLEVSIDDRRDSMLLIVAPDRAYWPAELNRAAGLAVHLAGVRSERNWGCGDFRDLRGIIDLVSSDLRASFVALNPLHAIANRRPYNTSPYLPNSVFYQNFIYLDVEAIEDFQKSPRALKLFQQGAMRSELESLRGSEHVEYERVHALKLRFLKLLFLAFLRELRSGSERAREFTDYLAREGELLEKFALYCALDEAIHRKNPEFWLWTEWPAPFRDPDSRETRAFRKKHWRAVMFYQYVQWQADLQLAAAQRHAKEKGLAIGLYHDLALATDRFGSDLWAHRRFYVAGCRVGAPPDDFSPKGQDWAFPPPNSDCHRDSGYRLFTETIRKNSRHGGALRIDHVMRFFRLYWIPEGSDATGGAYVRDWHLDLIRIVALESVRNKVVMVGEDLGTVEPHVRETLARFGILSYRLLYFEKNKNGEFLPLQDYPEQALVSSTTHDLPTLAGFWTNQDIEARRKAGIFHDDDAYRAQLADRAREKQKMLDVLFRLALLPDWFPRQASAVPELAGELHNAVIGFLALSPAKLMVVNQEDLTKEVEQQNLPGTTWQYPNWSRKMKFTLEQLRSEKSARDFTAMFQSWLERTGRLNY